MVIKTIHSHIVPKGIAKIRLQDYAPLVFKLYIPSKSGVKKAIKKELFYIDGEVAKTSTWVIEGQVIELVEHLNENQKIYELNLDVIYEDEHIAVINKPAGISVSGNSFKTIYNALLFNLSRSNETDSLQKPTPVHRLDNQTSGLLVIAKTKTAQIELGKQFENNTVNKKYSVISIGKVYSNSTINTPIENKIAETTFEVIKIIKSLKYNYLTCLKAYPKTGRTHQIRIHLASIGHPILGDKLYGDKETLHKGKGLFLCASEIKFLHPKTFDPIHLKIDIPHKFKSLLNREKRRWNTYNLSK